jgi:hypothetical protein
MAGLVHFLSCVSRSRAASLFRSASAFTPPVANVATALGSARLEKRRNGVVENAGDADDFAERPTVAPVRLPVCPNKPRAPANTLSRREKRNIAVQDICHQDGHLGLEEYGGGGDVKSGRSRQFGRLRLGFWLDGKAQKHPRAGEGTRYGGPVPTARP